jgi:hypothetical protein
MQMPIKNAMRHGHHFDSKTKYQKQQAENLPNLTHNYLIQKSIL